ncbi:MAG: hypothetical protein NTY65_06555 [Planctomycetota bacterium]|nr:hypothetical protein [Planctomycetota bacterium]
MNRASPSTLKTALDRVQLFVRGNLGALFANQVAMGVVNIILMYMIKDAYRDDKDVGRLAVVLSAMLAAVSITANGVAGSVTLRISRTRAEEGEGPSQSVAQTLGGGLALAVIIGVGMALLGIAAPYGLLEAARVWRPESVADIEAGIRPWQTAALWLPSYALLVVIGAVFDGFQRMRWSLLAEAGTFQVVRLLVAALVMYVAVWPWTGLVGAWAVGYAFAVALMAGELAVFLRLRGQPVVWRGLPLKGMLRDTVFMFLPRNAPTLFSHVGVLTAWIAGGPVAAAGFWVARNLSVAAVEFCQPIGRALFPALPGLDRMADRTQMARTLRSSFWAVSAMTFFFFILVQFAKGYILEVFHAGNLGPGLTVLLAVGFLEVHRTVFNPVLLATGREKALTVLEWVGLALVLVGGLAVTPTFGLMGLALVFLAVYILGAMVRVAWVASRTGVRMWADAAVTGAVVLAVTAAFLLCELRM